MGLGVVASDLSFAIERDHRIAGSQRSNHTIRTSANIEVHDTCKQG